MGRYDDIIDLPRPESVHKPISYMNRAAQFAPFAALTGHGEKLAETALLTVNRNDLSEYELEHLSTTLTLAMMKQQPPLTEITYFIPDQRKSGGQYTTVRGTIRRICEYENMLILDSGVRIPLQDINRIEIL